MNNTILQLKIKQRLNKIASHDYDNIECWQIVESFNKGQSDWCRRNLHGMNTLQEGDEESKRRIDDLQILLTEVTIPLSEHDKYTESPTLPSNYFEWKRLSAKATTECCDNTRNMVIYLAEVGNVDELLRDKNKQPSFEWGETFCTLQGNTIRIYTNNEFELEKAKLMYYRQPRKIQIAGCVDPYTTQVSAIDIECEFKDDLTEVFIDEAAKILAGDLESLNQQQIAGTQVETNN